MLSEARVSSTHDRALRAAGAVEPPDDVYRLMRVVYPGCFLAMAAEAWWRPGGGPVLAGASLFAAAKLLKWWAMRALGVRWTFRVLVPPGSDPVRRGPYQWLRHPNYLAVLGELIGVALMLGAEWTGIVAPLVFGALMWQRIRVEERALGRAL